MAIAVGVREPIKRLFFTRLDLVDRAADGLHGADLATQVILARVALIRLVRGIVVPFLITPHVRDHLGRDDVVSDAQDEEEPEEVQGLEADEQAEGDVLADPAFVLLRVPVEGEGAHVGEGAPGEDDGADDEEVEVVAEVDPDADEEGEVRDGDGGGEVVECFGCLCAASSYCQPICPSMLKKDCFSGKYKGEGLE